MTSASSQKSLYLPGLNGIRALAAISVVIGHINNRLPLYGLTKGITFNVADYAVTVFFTLSGFLITYLLLLEKSETGTIDIKKFYYRRILRIWPLYFFYLLLTFLIIGFDQLQWPILFFIFMIPNLGKSVGQYIPFHIAKFPGHNFLVGHYWSLGVEEQFYAFWPWIVKNSKHLLVILILFPLLYIVLKIILNITDAPKSILVFVNYTRFGCMFIGALGAYLYYHHKNILIKYFHNRFLEFTAIIFFILVTFNLFHIASPIDHEITSVFTLIIIINQISNPKKLLSLENKSFNFLGKISYGLYVWNPLIIYLLSRVFQNYLSDMRINIIVLLLSVFLINIFVIILVSYLSYEYFERKFLKMKKNYMIIKSSNSKND